MKYKRFYQNFMAGTLSLAMALPISMVAWANPGAGTELVDDYIMITNTNSDFDSLQEIGVLNGARNEESFSRETVDTDDGVHQDVVSGQKTTMSVEAKTYQIGDRLDGQYNGQSYECIYVGTNQLHLDGNKSESAV